MGKEENKKGTKFSSTQNVKKHIPHSH